MKLIYFQEKLFLTESNLQLQLDKLETETENMGQTDEQTAEEQPKVEVTEMGHKKLHLNIEVSVDMNGAGAQHFLQYCTQGRLRSVCASVQADQTLLSA